MKSLFLLLLSVLVLAYNQSPRIEDPETIVHKLDRIAFKGMNLSLQGLNDVNVTRRLAETKRVKFEGYGSYNLARHSSESGVHFKIKW